MKELDVCFSPELISSYDLEGKIAVVIDVLRATSCMTAALNNGIKEIYPVMTTDECLVLGEKGCLTAAERNGEKVEGFDFGNSPYGYIDNDVSGKILAMTTTNGTRTIRRSSHAREVVIGSFLNADAIIDYLRRMNEDVVFVCAGWKGRVNLEDTLFAAHVIDALKGEFNAESDGCVIALGLKEQCDKFSSRFEFLKKCNHVKRLSKQAGIMRDIQLCLSDDQLDKIPVLRGDKLVSLN